jgi:hypothetical protein
MKVQIQQANQDFDAMSVLRRTPYFEVPGAERSLYYCVSMSWEWWVGSLDGEVCCVWGLIPPTLLSDKAYLWLLVTDVVDRHRFVFIRQSQIFIQKALDIYPLIVGHVEVGNDKAVRWLKWLGATFGEPEAKRIPFQIRRK